MSQAAYIQDTIASPTTDSATGPGELANFYAGCNILITGSSGFLGRLLVERLLRSCADLKTMFLLLREKKGINPADRFKEIFDDSIFDRLKRERPEFARKVVLIEGDMAVVGLGLSSEQRELLRSTHIVMHSAATIRFDEQIRIATNINVRGTKELILLAKEMPGLKAFVHISTAYSNCISNCIEEKFYTPPMETDKLLDLMDLLDDQVLDRVTPVLLGKWPNTYTFTKAIAEDTVRHCGKNLPRCVVRPSIIIATAKEPIAGWVNNVSGATGVAAGAGVGLLHTLHCDENMVADLIPADYVVNNIIVAAWDTAKSQNENMSIADNSMVSEVEEPRVYNVVSSCQRPITWGEFLKYCKKCGDMIPSTKTVWYFTFRLNRHLWIHNIYIIILHLLPAIIIDSIAWITGQKPALLAAYRRIHKFSDVIEFFTMHQWRFLDDNAMRLLDSLNPADRKEFDLDIEKLNWENYNHNHIRGLRVFIMKDPLDTVPQGFIRDKRMKVAHYTYLIVLFSILFWLLLTVLRFIGRLW